MSFESWIIIPIEIEELHWLWPLMWAQMNFFISEHSSFDDYSSLASLYHISWLNSKHTQNKTDNLSNESTARCILLAQKLPPCNSQTKYGMLLASNESKLQCIRYFQCNDRALYSYSNSNCRNNKQNGKLYRKLSCELPIMGWLYICDCGSLPNFVILHVTTGSMPSTLSNSY